MIEIYIFLLEWTCWFFTQFYFLFDIFTYMSSFRLFKYSVEEIDLRGESCVDAEWMAYLGAFRYLQSIILADCHRINNSALWNITGLQMRFEFIQTHGYRHMTHTSQQVFTQNKRNVFPQPMTTCTCHSFIFLRSCFLCLICHKAAMKNYQQLEVASLTLRPIISIYRLFSWGH